MSSETLNTAGAFSQAKDLKNRIFFTILILIIYRLGTYVPLAGIDPLALKEIMSSGNLVSDDILNSIVASRLNNETGKGFILDGYPRTLKQSEFLNNFFHNMPQLCQVMGYLRKHQLVSQFYLHDILFQSKI